MLCLTLLPAAAYADGGTAVYVSSAGDDTAGNGSQSAPYATLAKAVEEAEDGATIYVMSDLTMTKCARYYDKGLTITSLDPNNPVTISRGTEFDPQSDHARSWYNPAMVEVQTHTGGEGAGLTLTNIIFDDDGKKEGTVFAQAVSDGSIDNKTCVQDAIIASNATVPTTITLGDGAVLRNFGGMSAVRVTDQAQLVMAEGSIIEDTTVTDRTKGKAQGEVGPAGAIWIQGSSFTMNAGAVIRNIIGRAVYADGGTATVGGAINDIKPDSDMWQKTNGIAIHLRNQAIGTLDSTCSIDNQNTKVGGESIICSNACDLTVYDGAVIKNATQTKGIAALGTCRVDFDGEITGLKGNSNALNLQNGEFNVTLGKNANIHDNQTGYGTIYIQAQNGKLDIYGKINNNTASDRGGAIAMGNNFQYPTIVTMYDGAEICNNYSAQTGGGVMVSVGTFTMKGGTISNNLAKMMGGGVYVRRGGNFIMEGGTIVENTTAEYGGGIAYEAGDYNNGIPCVTLNGGAITGNTMSATIEEDSETGKMVTSGGVSNDISVLNKDNVFSHIGRYLYISNDATIGNKAVYFQTNTKTVTPAEDSLDIKLGNASADSKAALKNASNGNGWADPLATFWAQRDGAAELTVGGLTLDSALPQIVYALVQETGADGKPVSGAEIKVYSTEITTDGIRLTLPNGYANGCAVALAQPTTDFGRVVISGPTEIAKTSDAVTYEVPYTATYTMSNNLLSMLQHAPHGVPMTFVVELDSRLTAKKGADGKFLYDFDGAGILEVDESSITVSPDGHTITVVCNPVTTDWANAVKDKTSVIMTLKGTGVLAEKGFDAGKYLNTTGHIEGAISVSGTPLPIMIPANVCQTRMTAHYSVFYHGNEADSGETVDSRSYIFGDLAVVSENGYVRDGHSFVGWNTQRDGSGTHHVPGSSITVTDHIHLYAQWTRNSSGDDDDTGYTLRLTKLDAGDGTPLSGAKFELWRVGTRSDTRLGVYETNRYGWTQAEVSQSGDYYWVETVPPEGYRLDGGKHPTDTAKNSRITVYNTEAAVPALFTDDHYAYIVGGPDGTVRPNDNMTRAGVATIFFRLLKDSVRDANLLTGCTYTDVPDGHWANTAISTMTGLDIVRGYDAAAFGPGDPITRAQFAAICARFDTGKSNGSRTFSDIEGHWAKAYIERAAELGWISGFQDGTFRPDAYITRAQAVTMINRMLNRLPEDPSDLLPGMNVWPDCRPGDWFYLAIQEATNSHDYRHKAGSYETWTGLNADPDWTRYEN
ncbi:S-layer homology domain-containing protein [Dysosmobacter sp.]|uniref:S-layer homology domain-containing protein n=1 Tax=Dysosmobacter sp. TaxID=2591382 RepID=UPI00307D59C3